MYLGKICLQVPDMDFEDLDEQLLLCQVSHCRGSHSLCLGDPNEFDPRMNGIVDVGPRVRVLHLLPLEVERFVRVGCRSLVLVAHPHQRREYQLADRCLVDRGHHDQVGHPTLNN